MKKNIRGIIGTLLALCLLLCAMPIQAEETTAAAPKYVFLFIGDGMGNPQVAATQYYLGATENPDSTMPVPGALSFTGFESLGMVTTYDASSFCPDSASTATSIASGEKTLSGVINYDVEKTTPFKLVTEYAKEAGKKVGVITSVSLDHATPAAFYAKVPSRRQYYDIAVQGLTGSTLDYLAGGGFLNPDGETTDSETGKVSTQENLFDIAAANGWTYVNSNADIRALSPESGRVLAINPVLQDSSAMTYEIDRVRMAGEGKEVLSLADFVTAGIHTLDNENGFFMMCEGGKIDWSGHANDAATSVHETIAFSDAVQVALDFAAEHPTETLIVVTADHETGGMTIGFATTAYDTHFNYLTHQIISFTDFDNVVATLRESGASFADALLEIEKYYGLTSQEGNELTLTPAETDKLLAGYTLSMQPDEDRVIDEEAEYLYGGYEPLSMAVSHIINNKAGLSYTSYSHTGLQIPVYATGAGAENFSGLYDNTEIFTRLMAAMNLER